MRKFTIYRSFCQFRFWFGEIRNGCMWLVCIIGKHPRQVPLGHICRHVCRWQMTHCPRRRSAVLCTCWTLLEKPERKAALGGYLRHAQGTCAFFSSCCISWICACNFSRRKKDGKKRKCHWHVFLSRMRNYVNVAWTPVDRGQLRRRAKNAGLACRWNTLR